MGNDVYVVLKDTSTDEGEGYSSNSYNEFMSVTSNFEKARMKMEAFAKEDGYENDDALIMNEDWDFIEIKFVDIFSTYIKYHIQKVKIE